MKGTYDLRAVGRYGREAMTHAAQQEGIQRRSLELLCASERKQMLPQQMDGLVVQQALWLCELLFQLLQQRILGCGHRSSCGTRSQQAKDRPDARDRRRLRPIGV